MFQSTSLFPTVLKIEPVGSTGKPMNRIGDCSDDPQNRTIWKTALNRVNRYKTSGSMVKIRSKNWSTQATFPEMHTCFYRISFYIAWIVLTMWGLLFLHNFSIFCWEERRDASNLEKTQRRDTKKTRETHTAVFNISNRETKLSSTASGAKHPKYKAFINYWLKRTKAPI